MTTCHDLPIRRTLGRYQEEATSLQLETPLYSYIFRLRRDESRLRRTTICTFAQKVLAELFRLGSVFLFSPIFTLHHSYADHQPTRPEGPPQGAHQVEIPRLGRQSISPRSVRSGHDADSEEAEFRDPQSCEGAPDEWY